MAFLSLRLRGYKRTALSGHKDIHFDLNNKEKVQIIVGSNGSGKSSLLRAFSWFPLPSSDFEEGGGYETTIAFRGSLYVLSGDFSKAPRYTIIKDGETLHNGGISMFKQIIEQETGLTKDLQDFFFGDLPFSRMSVAERKWLFNLMAGDAGDYAGRLFKALTQRLRDNTATVKYLAERCSAETAKLIPEVELATVTETLQQTRCQLEALYNKKENIQGNLTETLRRYDTLNTTIEKLATAILTTDDKHSEAAEANETTVSSTLLALKAQETALAIHENELSKAIKESLRLQSLLDLARNNAFASAQEIALRCEDLTNDIETLRASQHLTIKGDVDKQYLTLTEGLVAEFTALLLALPANQDGYYSNDAHQKLLTVQNELNTLIRQKEQAVLKAQVVVTGFEKAKEEPMTECPSCTHRWHRHYLAEQHQQAEIALAQTETELQFLQVKASTVSAELELSRDYLNALSALNRKVSTYLELEPLWSLLQEFALVKLNPPAAASMIQRYRDSLQTVIRIKAIENTIQELTTAKEQIFSCDRTINDLVAQVEQLAVAIDVTTLAIQSGKVEVNRLRSVVNLQQQYNSDVIQLNHLVIESENLERLIVALDAQTRINEEITACKRTLTDLEFKQHRYDIQHALVANLMQQRNDVMQKVDALETLVAVLSPSKGIIAEIMLGFIATFCQEVNAFVANIWLYPLELAIPSFEEGSTDLTYRFPIHLDGEERGKDVRETATNSGTVEILDFAIRVVTMKQLGFNQVLFLDEFANSLDYAHRLQAYSLLRSYLQFDDTEQVFCINHFGYITDSFQNPGITVLCDKNIERPRYPERINTNVTFN